MKKAFLLFGAVAIATTGYAQKKKIVEARDYFELKQFEKAIPAIEAAVTNDETKNNPDAWYLRGLIYEAIAIVEAQHQAQDPSYAPHPQIVDQAYTSFQKALELKPDLNDEMLPNALNGTAGLSYNNGIAAYNNKDYKTAYTDFSRVTTLYKVNGGKMFANDTAFKSMSLNAQQNAANAAVYDNNYAAALPILEQLKNTPGAADSGTYNSLIYIYNQQKNTAAELATIHEAQAKYPNVQSFKSAEENYFVNANDYPGYAAYQESVLQKDPNNVEARFKLANAYTQLAFPNDKSKPANFDDWSAKAESNALAVVKANPENASYNYAAGLVYYSKASLINDEIEKLFDKNNNLPPANQKKYDGLKASRNALFAQAIPYFEKTFSIDDAHAATLESPDDKREYYNTLLALRDIYNALGKKDKTELYAKKLEAANAAKK